MKQLIFIVCFVMPFIVLGQNIENLDSIREREREDSIFWKEYQEKIDRITVKEICNVPFGCSYEKAETILENKYGIAIVPYVYKQASDYYFALFLAQNANNEKNIADYIPRDREITISLPEVKRMPPKLFVFDDDDDYEEDYNE